MKSALTALVLSCTAAPLALAATPEPVQQHNSNAVWFDNWVGLSNGMMVVAAPNGKITTISAATGTPVFELNPAEAIDGVYRYELRAATEERVEIVNPQNNGRGDNQETTMAKPFYTTGHFVVKDGIIITPEAVEEEKG
ncbi:hypothetical protein ATO6_22605 [Oceanicola sp. 22II-s10i]|nr:hypothetical protein ATO6_22605 [Oceanicola sp. 22II-s10i]